MGDDTIRILGGSKGRERRKGPGPTRQEQIDKERRRLESSMWETWIDDAKRKKEEEEL